MPKTMDSKENIQKINKVKLFLKLRSVLYTLNLY